MSNTEIRDYGTILCSEDHGERNKLLYIFLQHQGVIRAFAFGAKNSKRRFGGNLEPYHLQHFYITQKRQAYTINEAKIERLFLDIRKSLTAIEMLQNISNVLIKIPVADSKRLFKLFYFLLKKLDRGDEREEMFKAYYLFLIYFLYQEGYFPKNPSCFECGKNGENRFLISSNNEPQFLCSGCISDAGQAIILADNETTDFITNCLHSAKRLFSKLYNPKTYELLSKISQLLFNTHFHIQLKKIEW